MHISAILNELERNQVAFDYRGPVEKEIERLDCDSRSAVAGSMFFALRGSILMGMTTSPKWSRPGQLR